MRAVDEPAEGTFVENRTWQLRRGEELIGGLTLEVIDMFWYDCRFEPSASWPTLRPFAEASRDAWQRRDMEAAVKADEAMHALGLELVPDDGSEPITRFVLRVSGNVARFKWY